MMIRDSATLANLCATLREQGSFALDTEFHREGTYMPRLFLVQVAARGTAAAIDPLAPVDLSPLLELIFDPAVETIVHAGWQDFEIFYHRTGRLPANVFDTQMAAALAGIGEEIGYANLLEKVLGVSISKIETVTDWSARPLTKNQVQYALDDVRYLPDLRDRLDGALGGLGRREWMRQEARRYGDPASYEKNPRLSCLRIRGARNLPPAGLAVLQELAAWREEEAARRDVPRGRVVADEILMEAAKRCPRSEADLRQIRGFLSREIGKIGKAMVHAVERGLAVPPGEIPILPPGRADDPRRALLLDILDAAVRVRSHEAKIASSYLATRAEMADLVDVHLGGMDPMAARSGAPIAVLDGWRRDLVGADLVRILRGEIALVIDPSTGMPSLRPSAQRSS